MTTPHGYIKAALRRARNRLLYRWLTFQLERKIKELHYLSLQRAADQFSEEVLLSEVKVLQQRLEGRPVELPAVTSPMR